MRSANGDTSTSLWVGIFSAGSASTAVPPPPRGPFASFAPSSLLVGAENAPKKRIETPERDLSVAPVVGSVAKDIEQLLARFLVELAGGRNLLEHHDETGLL